MKKYILTKITDANSTERSHYVEDFDNLGIYDTFNDAWAELTHQRDAYIDIESISFDIMEVDYYPTN